MEVGTPPNPSYMLTGLIPGTPPAPGNVKWVERSMTLGPYKPNSTTNFQKMIYDDELKSLHTQAFNAYNEDPSSIVTMLERLEQEHKDLIRDDTEEWQNELENLSQSFSAQMKREADYKATKNGRATQGRIGRSLRNKIVPVVRLALEQQHKSALNRNSGRHWGVVKPLVETLDHDWLTIAHIGVSTVLDCIGRVGQMQVKYATVLGEIGERLDHQAYLCWLEKTDPRTFSQVDNWYLRKGNQGYGYKMRKVIDDNPLGYPFLDAKQRAHVGDWLMSVIQYATGWFDTILWHQRRGKKGYSKVYYLGLSELGLKYRDLIQAAADDAAFDAWPMVHKPLPWSMEERGGYLNHHPGRISELIHNDKGTILSKDTLDALNNHQEVALQVNPFIYGVLKNLLARTEEIGKFRTYEADSWWDVNAPKIHPDTWDLPRDEHGHEHREIVKAKAMLAKAYSEQKASEKKRKPPLRVLMVAARFLHCPRFYSPWYTDQRGRIYPAVDALSPQGTDYVKALLRFADGNRLTPDNEAAIERDLLIGIANCWGNREGDTKTDKLTLEGRQEFSRKFLKELEVVARDPLSTAARVLWTSASEPFMFLALVREWFELFVWKTSTVAQVPVGFDATNSALQLTSCFMRDPKGAHFSNVTPTETPQDAYGEVARHAQAYLRSDVWVANEIDRAKKRALAKEKRILKEQKERAEKGLKVIPYKLKTDGMVFNLDPSVCDRSVFKRLSMCTGYNASYSSKAEYVAEELDSVSLDLHAPISLTEKVIVTMAGIAGQTAAFPRCAEMAKWFMTFAAACLDQGREYIEWTTPSGNKIVQEYRDPLIERVQTHAMGGGHYWAPQRNKASGDKAQISFQTGWGDIRNGKMATALSPNFVHSIDASVIHLTFCDWEDRSFFSCHDCVYAPAGSGEKLVEKVRHAFHKCVTYYDPFQHLIETNEVQELAPPPKGDLDLDLCLQSTYLYS